MSGIKSYMDTDIGISEYVDSFLVSPKQSEPKLSKEEEELLDQLLSMGQDIDIDAIALEQETLHREKEERYRQEFNENRKEIMNQRLPRDVSENVNVDKKEDTLTSTVSEQKTSNLKNGKIVKEHHSMKSFDFEKDENSLEYYARELSLKDKLKLELSSLSFKNLNPLSWLGSSEHLIGKINHIGNVLSSSAFSIDSNRLFSRGLNFSSGLIKISGKLLSGIGSLFNKSGNGNSASMKSLKHALRIPLIIMGCLFAYFGTVYVHESASLSTKITNIESKMSHMGSGEFVQNSGADEKTPNNILNDEHKLPLKPIIVKQVKSTAPNPLDLLNPQHNLPDYNYGLLPSQSSMELSLKRDQIKQHHDASKDKLFVDSIHQKMAHTFLREAYFQDQSLGGIARIPAPTLNSDDFAKIKELESKYSLGTMPNYLKNLSTPNYSGNFDKLAAINFIQNSQKFDAKFLHGKSLILDLYTLQNMSTGELMEEVKHSYNVIQKDANDYSLVYFSGNDFSELRGDQAWLNAQNTSSSNPVTKHLESLKILTESFSSPDLDPLTIAKTVGQNPKKSVEQLRDAVRGILPKDMKPFYQPDMKMHFLSPEQRKEEEKEINQNSTPDATTNDQTSVTTSSLIKKIKLKC